MTNQSYETLLHRSTKCALCIGGRVIPSGPQRGRVVEPNRIDRFTHWLFIFYEAPEETWSCPFWGFVIFLQNLRIQIPDSNPNNTLWWLESNTNLNITLTIRFNGNKIFKKYTTGFKTQWTNVDCFVLMLMHCKGLFQMGTIFTNSDICDIFLRKLRYHLHSAVQNPLIATIVICLIAAIASWHSY